MKLWVVLAIALTCVAAVPFNDVTENEAAYLQEEKSSSTETAAELAALRKATTNVAKGQGQKAEKLLDKVDKDEVVGENAAAQVNKLASSIQAKWGSPVSLEAELKASEHVAHTLMAMNGAATKVETIAAKDAGSMSQELLGEGEAKSTLLQKAKQRAKDWIDSQKLALAAKSLQRAEKKVSWKENKPGQDSLVQIIELADKKDDILARKMTKQIGKAGLALNKWYDQKKSSLQKHSPTIGEGRWNNAQKMIRKQAMESIKQVEESATKAIQAAGAGRSKSAKLEAKAKLSFNTMKGQVNKVAGPVGKEARLVAKREKQLIAKLRVAELNVEPH